MSSSVPPRGPLVLSLALLASTAGCVLVTDFEPTEDGTDGSTGSGGGSGNVTTAETGIASTDGPGNVTTAETGIASTDGTGITTASGTDAGDTTAPGIETDGSDTAGSDTAGSGTEGSDTGPEVPLPDCPGVGLGGAGVGEACASNAECESALCTIFTEAPINPDAVCAVPPLDCSMRVTGTSLDIVTGQPVAGAELRVVSALQAATNPAGAAGIVAGPSAGDGRLDLVTPGPVVAPIGIVALLEAPGYSISGTPLAVPPEDGGTSYGVGNDAHDLWLVSDVALAAWSVTLAQDAEIPPEHLPLGPAGGVVGLVRDAAGVPASGATVSPTNLGSPALVRYLNDDGTFGTVATGSLGLFVILDSGLGEPFEAELDGASLGPISTASASGVVVTIAFTAP